MAQAKLTFRTLRGARVEEIERLATLHPCWKRRYRNAQWMVHGGLSRRRFPHRFPLTFSLLARTSSDSIPGTWGFGLWNDPFGMSLGFGGNPFRLPALPNAVWFFGASKENYLSFKDDKPANGFLAQTFRAPKFHPLLIPAGLALPFSRKTTRRMLGGIIGEDGVAVSVDVAEWHRYSLTWEEKRVSLEVDNVEVFESAVSPNPPLGLVIWIDNQYASFTPDGKIGFGVLANPEPAFLEIRDLEFQ
ncbi:MAG: hypothetical protein U0X92_07530 [Anaerolineales bacterium]